MKEYDFTLKYRLGDASADPENYAEALAEAGCEDALIGVGQNGRISLNFIRQAGSALEAISSAIDGVQTAIPDVSVGMPDWRAFDLANLASVLGRVK